ncbi:MAG: hypothetical protein ACFCU4_05775 [Puniceicoccaceae bacterium]
MLCNAGYEIPRDLGLAHLDWSPHFTVPGNGGSFAGIDQMGEILGAQAIDLLTREIESGMRGFTKKPNSMIWEGVWQDGVSLARR